MTVVAHLFWRNCRIFLRDRVTLVFTATAPVVLMALFVIFFREMTARSIARAIVGDGFAVDPMQLLGPGIMSDVYAMCDAWLFASCVTMSTFACSLGMLASFVEDRSSGRFSDYLVSPVRRGQLTLGYILSSFVVAVVVSSGFMALGQLWAAVKGQAVMTPTEALGTIGAIALSSISYGTLHVFAVTFLASQGGLGGYSLIGGIAVGFLSYCYVPPGGLSAPITNTVGIMPFAQSAALVREPIMGPSMDRLIYLVNDPTLQESIRYNINKNFGADLYIDGRLLPPIAMVAMLSVLALLCAVIGSRRMGRVIR
ncbi:MAG: hypothetical protein LBH76_06200 [Propionibacteriaceae bacterium]|jgi:multidrug/hemolysin transport system permease protein|nr:hypothetical protein [Propionibacteriaceae bacterium]